MKTNKIYKLFAIMLILIVTMFSFGCGKSQKEEFNQTYTETAKMVDSLNATLIKIENENIDALTMHKRVKSKVFEYEKDLNKQLEKLEKLSKGNEKLEKEYNGIKSYTNGLLTQYKIKINQNEKALF